eukprot:716216-Prorocentrum_minimum.AAC.2
MAAAHIIWYTPTDFRSSIRSQTPNLVECTQSLLPNSCADEDRGKYEPGAYLTTARSHFVHSSRSQHTVSPITERSKRIILRPSMLYIPCTLRVQSVPYVTKLRACDLHCALKLHQASWRGGDTLAK